MPRPRGGRIACVGFRDELVTTTAFQATDNLSKLAESGSPGPSAFEGVGGRLRLRRFQDFPENAKTSPEKRVCVASAPRDDSRLSRAAQ